MGLRRRHRHDHGRPVRHGNIGTITGATWTTAGKFGNALTFNGINDLVTVADANSLDLTTGMTLEAWVRPTALGNDWRTALLKEQPGGLTYALYAHGTDATKVPTGEVFINGFRIAGASTALAANTWTHLATTYNGTALAVYVNGVQAGQLLITGSIPTSTGALRIGGNNDLGRVVPGRHRRGPRLQPRPRRHRDPGRHEPPGHEPRHRGAAPRRARSLRPAALRRRS